MPHKSPWTLDIDVKLTDLLSYVFPQGTQPSDVPIWIDANNTKNALSLNQCLHWVRRLGVGLDKLGSKQGDPIMVFSSNHIFVPVAYLAIAGSGRIFTGCNPAYGAEETAFQLKNTKAKFIFVEPPFLQTVLKAAARLGFSKDRIFLFSDRKCKSQDGVRDVGSILGDEKESEQWRWERMSADEAKKTVAVLNYSSGTTGLPKGVMISHQNVIANVEQSIFMRNLEQPYDAASQPQERWLGFLPLYHAYGQLWSIVAAAVTGTPVFMMRTFQFDQFLLNIQRHQITHIQTAPPVLVMLMKKPMSNTHDLSSLKGILCGAAPLSRDLQNQVSKRFELRVVQTWGMTELTCSCLHVPGGRDDQSGSVGFIDPNSEIKLVDDRDHEVKDGEAGEILVRGPNVCLGYWQNKDATRDLFDDDRFLRTGDIAVRSKEGMYRIVDRKKELIKVSGFQVAPAELEALLLSHDGIADVAVVGMFIENDERPRAYVVLAEDAKPGTDEAMIQSWLAQRVAKHKRLTGGVKFIKDVPKSPSGKIQRKVLRQMAKRDAQTIPQSKEPKARL